MSCIHYKLVTNINYEKLMFDGVNINVNDLKREILEKKFKRFPYKSIDIDLEITNADTNEVYTNETDTIPKNSRVYVKRVIKNIQPVKGGIITTTKKDQELKEAQLNKTLNSNLFINQAAALTSLSSTTTTTTTILNNNEFKHNQSKQSNNEVNKDTFTESQESPTKSAPSSTTTTTTITNTNISNTVNIQISNYIPATSNDTVNIVDNIKLNTNASNHKVQTHNVDFNKNYLQKNEVHQQKENIYDDDDDDFIMGIKNRPEQKVNSYPQELTCPFGNHLMKNAVMVNCCGYFICCEECIQDRLNPSSELYQTIVECPIETCLQEITSAKYLTPYKPIRNMVQEYLKDTGIRKQKVVENEQQTKIAIAKDIDVRNVNTINSLSFQPQKSHISNIDVSMSLHNPPPIQQTAYLYDTIQPHISNIPTCYTFPPVHTDNYQMMQQQFDDMMNEDEYQQHTETYINSKRSINPANLKSLTNCDVNFDNGPEPEHYLLYDNESSNDYYYQQDSYYKPTIDYQQNYEYHHVGMQQHNFLVNSNLIDNPYNSVYNMPLNSYSNNNRNNKSYFNHQMNNFHVNNDNNRRQPKSRTRTRSRTRSITPKFDKVKSISKSPVVSQVDTISEPKVKKTRKSSNSPASIYSRFSSASSLNKNSDVFSPISSSSFSSPASKSRSPISQAITKPPESTKPSQEVIHKNRSDRSRSRSRYNSSSHNYQSRRDDDRTRRRSTERRYDRHHKTDKSTRSRSRSRKNSDRNEYRSNRNRVSPSRKYRETYHRSSNSSKEYNKSKRHDEQYKYRGNLREMDRNERNRSRSIDENTKNDNYKRNKKNTPENNQELNKFNVDNIDESNKANIENDKNRGQSHAFDRKNNFNLESRKNNKIKIPIILKSEKNNFEKNEKRIEEDDKIEGGEVSKEPALKSIVHLPGSNSKLNTQTMSIQKTITCKISTSGISCNSDRVVSFHDKSTKELDTKSLQITVRQVHNDINNPTIEKEESKINVAETDNKMNESVICLSKRASKRKVYINKQQSMSKNESSSKSDVNPSVSSISMVSNESDVVLESQSIDSNSISKEINIDVNQSGTSVNVNQIEQSSVSIQQTENNKELAVEVIESVEHINEKLKVSSNLMNSSSSTNLLDTHVDDEASFIPNYDEDFDDILCEM